MGQQNKIKHTNLLQCREDSYTWVIGFCGHKLRLWRHNFQKTMYSMKPIAPQKPMIQLYCVHVFVCFYETTFSTFVHRQKSRFTCFECIFIVQQM
jgi:hypothetical protein